MGNRGKVNRAGPGRQVLYQGVSGPLADVDSDPPGPGRSVRAGRQAAATQPEAGMVPAAVA
jgi:hypothetical protein